MFFSPDQSTQQGGQAPVRQVYREPQVQLTTHEPRVLVRKLRPYTTYEFRVRIQLGAAPGAPTYADADPRSPQLLALVPLLALARAL